MHFNKVETYIFGHSRVKSVTLWSDDKLNMNILMCECRFKTERETEGTNTFFELDVVIVTASIMWNDVEAMSTQVNALVVSRVYDISETWLFICIYDDDDNDDDGFGCG
jgi:hypothetical protein